MNNIENFMADPITWGQEPKSVEQHNKERAEYGFSTFDWWNFCEYNSWVMINALEKFKTGAGYPVHGEVETMEDWVRVLTEIQDGFKAMIAMSDLVGPRTSPEWIKLENKWKRAMELLTVYYGSLWD